VSYQNDALPLLLLLFAKGGYQMWSSRDWVDVRILVKDMLQNHDQSTGLEALHSVIHVQSVDLAEMASQITAETVKSSDSSSDLCCRLMYPNAGYQMLLNGTTAYICQCQLRKTNWQ
jgi:hypothetical protein